MLRVSLLIVACLIALPLSVYLLDLARLVRARRAGTVPPGPLPLPLIGSLHLLRAQAGADGRPLVHMALLKLAEKYGGMYALRLGSYDTVVISKPELAHEAFIVNGKSTSDRSPLQSHGGRHVPTMEFATRNGKGIAMSVGDYWHRVHLLLIRNITSKPAVQMNIDTVLRESRSLIHSLLERAELGEPIEDLRARLKHQSMNVITMQLLSKRFDFDADPDCKELQDVIEYIFTHLASGNPSDMMPLLRLFDFATPALREMKKVVRRRDRVLDRIIAAHRSTFDAGAPPRDVLDRLFLDNEISDDERHIVVWDILFGGTHTTAATTEWLLYYLINYPEVQRKIQRELDAVVGPDRLPEFDDIAKLNYLEAVLNEVMRIKIISPVLAPHYCSEEVKIGGYTLPRGTGIYVHAWAMSRDPQLWSDPEQFDPDRWYREEAGQSLQSKIGEKRRHIDQYKFMPFSVGPRACPGEGMAKISLLLQIATLLHCFEWSAAGNTPLDLTECWGLAVMPDDHAGEGRIHATARAAVRHIKQEVAAAKCCAAVS